MNVLCNRFPDFYDLSKEDNENRETKIWGDQKASVLSSY